MVYLISVNVCSLSEKKLNFLLSKNPDILLLQETKCKDPPKFDETKYKCHNNYSKYAGVMTFIKVELVKEFSNVEILIPGRVTIIRSETKDIFNIYHMRVNNQRTNILERNQYDLEFLEIVKKYKDRITIFFGDFNSVHRFEDGSPKRKGIPEDPTKKIPEEWIPGKPINTDFGSEEKHFMNFFINSMFLKDVGEFRGEYTFHNKKGQECMRIDYCLINLSKLKLIQKYMTEFNPEISDHKIMEVLFD